MAQSCRVLLQPIYSFYFINTTLGSPRGVLVRVVGLEGHFRMVISLQSEAGRTIRMLWQRSAFIMHKMRIKVVAWWKA